MSGIWGVVSLKNQEISREKAEKMKGTFEKYRIDRLDDTIRENVVFGCGLQYFTKESQCEKLPYEEEGIFFTADVTLDNRMELMKELELEKEERIVPDGEILYKMYKKYGEQCLERLLGSYVFVYYNQKENTIDVISDASGSRCLYYKYSNGMFQFSSVIEALVEKGEKKKINQRWVTDFIGLDNLVSITECEETIYQDIYKVEPAHVLKINSLGIEKKRYWNPAPQELKLKSDSEYKEEFIKIFKEVVTGLLRAEKTGLLLSGGLDSSTVACFAAPELKKQGKKLYTFTSVPEEGDVSEKNAYNVTNESSKVKKTAEYLGNLECHFIDLAGKDPWSGHYEIKKGLEIPYKSVQNLQWILEALGQAYQMGARIMLEGGYGNVTISNGNPTTYLNTLLSKGRIISYIKEINFFAKRYQWRKKDKYKIAMKIAKRYFFSKKQEENKEEILGKAYIKKDKIEEYKLCDRIWELNQKRSQSKRNIVSNRQSMLDNIQLSHKGEIKTKESLMTGVLSRDPCMDRRVIEFCMSLPVEQFCYQGVTRRLIRDHMEGIVPDHIIKIEDYGCQSADMLWKIQKNWDTIKKEITEILYRNENNEIIDVKKVLKDMDELEKDMLHQNIFDFTRLFYTVMVVETLEEI